MCSTRHGGLLRKSDVRGLRSDEPQLAGNLGAEPTLMLSGARHHLEGGDGLVELRPIRPKRRRTRDQPGTDVACHPEQPKPSESTRRDVIESPPCHQKHLRHGVCRFLYRQPANAIRPNGIEVRTKHLTKPLICRDRVHSGPGARSSESTCPAGGTGDRIYHHREPWSPIGSTGHVEVTVAVDGHV